MMMMKTTTMTTYALERLAQHIISADEDWTWWLLFQVLPSLNIIERLLHFDFIVMVIGIIVSQSH